MMTAKAADLQPSTRPEHPRWPNHQPLPLSKARSYADRIMEWISPRCWQMEPVGAIRRRCATVEQIELLVMPRFEANANLLFNFLDDHVNNEPLGAARWQHSTGDSTLKGLPPAHYDSKATIFLRRCTLTVHCARPETWFLRLFETTGSVEHVNMIKERIRSLPGTWEDGEFIRVRNRRVVPQSEGHVYEALNMEPVVAWKRTGQRETIRR